MFASYMLSDTLEFKIEFLEITVLNHYYMDIEYLEPIELYHIVESPPSPLSKLTLSEPKNDPLTFKELLKKTFPRKAATLNYNE